MFPPWCFPPWTIMSVGHFKKSCFEKRSYWSFLIRSKITPLKRAPLYLFFSLKTWPDGASFLCCGSDALSVGSAARCSWEKFRSFSWLPECVHLRLLLLFSPRPLHPCDIRRNLSSCVVICFAGREGRQEPIKIAEEGQKVEECVRGEGHCCCLPCKNLKKRK